MTKRIIAIAFIFVCASVAWAVLGATIFARTYDSAASADNRVTSIWGAPQDQAPPTASFRENVSRNEESREKGKKIEKKIGEEERSLRPGESSAVVVGLDLEHGKKGLLWYSTYKVALAGN